MITTCNPWKYNAESNIIKYIEQCKNALKKDVNSENYVFHECLMFTTGNNFKFSEEYVID